MDAPELGVDAGGNVLEPSVTIYAPALDGGMPAHAFDGSARGDASASGPLADAAAQGVVDAAAQGVVDAAAAATVDAAAQSSVDAAAPVSTDAALPVDAALTDAAAIPDAAQPDAAIGPSVSAVEWIAPVRGPKNDASMDVQVGPDGTVVVGVNRFLPSATDVADRPPYIVAVGPDGQERFRISFQPSQSSYFGFVPHVDPGDGSIRVYGYFDGAVQLGGGTDRVLQAAPGEESAFIASYSASGQLQWARELRQTSGRPTVVARRILPGGDFVFAGSWYGTLSVGDVRTPSMSSRYVGSARESHYVARIDRAGNVRKVQGFASVCDSSNGSSRVADVLANPDREIVLVYGGSCHYTVDPYGDHEQTVEADGALLVLGADGTLVEGLPTPSYFFASSSVALPSGDFAVMGQAGTWRFNAMARYAYLKPGRFVGQLGDGTFVLTAAFTAGSISVEGKVTLTSDRPYTVYAMGYKPDGQLAWARKLASYARDEHTSLELTAAPNGDLTLAGPCPLVFGDESPGPSGNVCVTRLDAAGNLAWNRAVTNGSGDFSASITPRGKVWLELGNARGSQWQVSANTSRAADGADRFVGRYAADGTLEELLATDIGTFLTSSALHATPDGGVVVARRVDSSPYRLFPGDPAARTLTLAPGDEGDGVIAKLWP